MKLATKILLALFFVAFISCRDTGNEPVVKSLTKLIDNKLPVTTLCMPDTRHVVQKTTITGISNKNPLNKPPLFRTHLAAEGGRKFCSVFWPNFQSKSSKIWDLGQILK